ncbi:MAG: putative motility protein [Planctomycetes bacterium]|nr:putative motility protein [Planctomycetota bacterium]
MDVSAVTASKQAQVQTQVQVELLKKMFDAQKEMMQQILASMGVGTQVDVQA